MKKILILLTALICITNVETNAQDSLYLIGTITGESTEKQITNVKGIGDINGDGYDDFMVSSRTGKLVRDQGIVKLYLGASDGNLIPDITFHYPGADTLNYFGTASGIGDINNDSYDDFAITGLFADYSGYGKGKVFIYLGGSTIDTIPVKEFYEPLWIEDDFGYPTEAVGDINQDGYDDFIISSPYNWSNGRGYAYLFWGGDTISWARCDTISGDLFYPQSFANIGDINNDSFDDIAIGVIENPIYSDSGKVFIYYGGNQMNTQPDTIIINDSLSYDFGRIIKNAGDLNNDGIIDFFVLGGGYMSLYSGLYNHTSINVSLLGFGGFLNIEADLDINSDGYNDFVIGNTNYLRADSVWVGGIFIYLGSDVLDTVYNLKFEGETRGSEFSKIMSHSDINGDGYDELIVLSPSYPDFNNPKGKVYIYSYKRITDVKEGIKNTPNSFQLYQNYPNPFNPITKIKYAVPIVADALNASTTNILLKVYDVLGNEIATLVDGQKHPGIYEVELDGSNLSSGVYFYRLQVGNPSANSGRGYSETKKIILLK
ncbi:MAG: T9SS type A sorting domain-containing protein [Ignavibacteriae bacterium]|nr:T9SS C-terminal target domain-containing protein [Ignavibacteriota bacterium]NOG99850.1 T9SS type A sorting domain-containing protein [Ignavibacteriota bacterium]